MLRPSTARGMPALGMAASGSVVAGAHGFHGGQHRRRAGGAVDAHRARRPTPSAAPRPAAAKPRPGRCSRRPLSPSPAPADAARRPAPPPAPRALHSAPAWFQQSADRRRRSARILICSANAARASSRPVLPSGSSRTPSGPTRSGHPGFAALLLFRFSTAWRASRTPAALISVTFVGQPVARQPDPVGPKGVGLQNLRPRLQILLVDRENQARVGEIQLVVAAVDKDAAGIKHGAHGAVGEQRAVGERSRRTWLILLPC